MASPRKICSTTEREGLELATKNRPINRIDNVEKKRKGISDKMLSWNANITGLNAKSEMTSIVDINERRFANRTKAQIRKSEKNKTLIAFSAIRCVPNANITGAANKGKPHG